MKINDIEYIVPFNCFIYLNGEIYEFGASVAELWIEDKLEVLIKEK